MKTKLTLSIDEDLARFAHTEARHEKRSVSSIFSEFLMNRREQATRQQTASAAAMTGSLKQYAIDDTKSGIRKAYAQKHLS